MELDLLNLQSGKYGSMCKKVKGGAMSNDDGTDMYGGGRKGKKR